MKSYKVNMTIPMSAENSLDAYKKVMGLGIPYGGYYFIIKEDKGDDAK